MDSVSAELAALVGVESTASERPEIHNWREICCCGHLVHYHCVSTGGTAPERPSGLPAAIPYVFHGCIGELPPKGTIRRAIDPPGRRPGADLARWPTCPCTEHRPVARVDRPSRFFNQKRPANREDFTRHPFLTGMRAYRTRIGRIKAIDGDIAKRDAEFDRRFEWLDGKRMCARGKCTETADVWPVFVDADDRSELRCPQHR